MAAAKKPAAPKAPKPGEDEEVATVKALSVQSKRDGFRRAGRVWSKECIVVPLSELTKDEIKQIRNESMLIVEDIDVAADGDAE